jgi:hypothetical protein
MDIVLVNVNAHRLIFWQVILVLVLTIRRQFAKTPQNTLYVEVEFKNTRQSHQVQEHITLTEIALRKGLKVPK